MKPELDLLIPCYNPPSGWAATILDSYKELSQHLSDTNIHVILVNDGSLQGVSEEDIALLKANIPYFHYTAYQQNQGKGYALREAAKHANSDLQILIDVDFPYTTDSIIAVYHSLVKEGSDMALGFRNAAYYKHTPLIRKMISKSLRFVLKYILRLPVTDTQCGLKGFNEKGKAIFLKTRINSYLFDLEFVMLGSKHKLKHSAVHVTLKEGVIFTRMKLSILLKEASHFFRLMLSSS